MAWQVYLKWTLIGVGALIVIDAVAAEGGVEFLGLPKGGFSSKEEYALVYGSIGAALIAVGYLFL
jgi:hypothetical protein